MKNSKNTKKALVFSCLSVVLCLTMLIGSTFAWFTDNASTNVNTIQAGTLDIALEMSADGTTWADAAGETLGFVKAAGHESEEVLWEPGCTYALPQLRVVNNGNLALKFKIIINPLLADDDAELAEVLDVLLNDVKVGTLAEMTTASAVFTTGNLLPGATSTPAYAISLHMQETAGNAYQGLTIDGISVTVLATQDTVEHDSTTNQYDASATYDDLPRALVTKLDLTTIPESLSLDVAYKFETTETAAEAAAGKYAAWNGDFVISFDQYVTDVDLFGQYDSFSSDWVGIPLTGVAAGEELRLLKDSIGWTMTYTDLCDVVKTFKCGAKDVIPTSDAGTVMTVELRLYEVVSGAETGNYEVIGTYQYTF